MFLEFPWALAALAALPVLTIIYLLRNRSQTRIVSALFLWSSPLQAANQGQQLQKLQSSWLLLLELLILSLLIFAAANVHILWKTWNRATVLILDDSWSMQACRQDALDKINQMILKKQIGFPVQVIKVGLKAHLAGTSCRYQSELNEQLLAWNPQSPECDWTAVDEIASRYSVSDESHAAAQQAARSVIITDTPVQSLAQSGKIAVIAVGKSYSNAAFSSAIRSSESTGQKDTIIAEVANLSRSPSDINITARITQNGKTDSQVFRLALPAGESRGIRITAPSAAQVQLQLPPDALQLDNTVILPALPRHDIRIRLAIAHPALARAVKKAVELAQSAQRSVQFVQSNENLLITDAPGSSDSPRVWTLRFYVPQKPIKEIQPVIYKGPYVIDTGAPLTLGTDFSATLWGAEQGNPLSTPSTQGTNTTGAQTKGIPLISVGDIPLVSEYVGASGARQIHFAFVPELSNILQSPNFPIFLFNLIKMRSESLPGLQKRAVNAGEVFLIGQESNEQKFIQVTAPDKTRQEAEFKLGQAVIPANQIGKYEFISAQRAYSGAVNAINPQESNLLSCDSGEWGLDLTKAELQRQYVSLRVPLLLLVLILACIHQYWINKPGRE